MKFNPLAEVAGKRLVIVDDSIVRGSTMNQLVAMLFDAGAAEVHVRVSSPPIVSPCFYGIDMADEEQLAAAHRSVEQMRELIGATSLHYLSLEGMQAATRLPEQSVCRACFTRDYPTRGARGAEPGEAPLRAGRAVKGRFRQRGSAELMRIGARTVETGIRRGRSSAARGRARLVATWSPTRRTTAARPGALRLQRRGLRWWAGELRARPSRARSART